MPEIRFPEFSGEWRPAKGRNAFGKRNAKGEAGLPIWSVTIDRGLVPRDSLERKGDDAADGTNLRAQPGDLVYNTMRMWQGAVGRATEECMLSPAYVVLAPKKGTVSEFFEYWFKAPRMLDRLWAYSHGLTSDRLRLYYDDFAQIPMAMPTPAEQRKISTYLSALDTRLNGLQQEKALLAQYKKGFMDRIFVQDVRFRTDDGSEFPEWKQVRLGDHLRQVSRRVPANTHLPVYSSSREGLKRQEDYFADSRVLNDGEYGVVGPGEITYRHMSDDLTFKFNLNDLGYDIAVSKEYPVFDSADFDLRFLREWLNNSEAFARFAITQKLGGTRTRLYFKDLAAWRVTLPYPEEQRKIAEALGAIDSKINAVAKQIDRVETFKRGMLQKMFV